MTERIESIVVFHRGHKFCVTSEGLKEAFYKATINSQMRFGRTGAMDRDIMDYLLSDKLEDGQAEPAITSGPVSGVRQLGPKILLP